MAEFTLNQNTVEQLVLQAVQSNIMEAVESLGKDPAWLEKIEDMINKAVVYQTISHVGSIDINSIIKERVDENMDKYREKLRANFSTMGISDQASEIQLTVMDDHTVVENTLTARELNITEGATIRDLAVTGSINIDNQSWNLLSEAIAEKTLLKINQDWQDGLVKQVVQQIQTAGIDFKQVTVDGQLLLQGDRLGGSITESSLQSVGQLRDLTVNGEAKFTETLNVTRRRVGVNTESPESALSVWDEEVAINIGKIKDKQAYVGTSRAHGISFGTNRQAHIEIDADGLTAIKKLQVGVHKISHSPIVPGWAGTRGDIVFNANPGKDRVFAWVCLGSFNWQSLKSAE
jgi:hypothetical protein